MTHTGAAHRAAVLGTSADGSCLTLNTGKDLVPTVRQRVARAKAQVRPARPADLEGATARIAQFTPADPRLVPHVGLLRALAEVCCPYDGIDAGELLSALAGHASWLVATGRDVTADALVNPVEVDHWVLVGLAEKAAGTAANYRSRLARVALASGCGPARRPPMHAGNPCAPYTRDQEERFLTSVLGMRTGRLRDDLLTVLCLGFGVGLSTAEMVETDGGDVAAAGGGATVTAHAPRSRVVPVRAAYAGDVLALASRAGGRPLFRSDAPGRVGKNAVSNLVTGAFDGAGPGQPRLTPQRMRATWLVRHLDAGVRADVLLAAAGLDDLGTLDRYLPSLAPVPAAAALALLARSGA